MRSSSSESIYFSKNQFPNSGYVSCGSSSSKIFVRLCEMHVICIAGVILSDVGVGENFLNNQ